MYETKEGDRIVLGSQTWRVMRIDADRVIVEYAEPGSSRMPFWRGESAPRSEMLGEALAKFQGEMVGRMTNDEARMTNQIQKTNESNAQSDSGVIEWLIREHHFDGQAAENAVGFYQRQMSKGAVPVWGDIVVEHFVDRAGEPIIAILLPLGSRVNYALRLALEGQFARRRLPAQVVHHDDGLIIRPPIEVGEIPENPLAWLKSHTLEQEIIDQLESTALFGLRFRQNAARALMLPRMTLSQRTPLWQQRLRARHLLALVKQERNFPIMVETYRGVLAGCAEYSAGGGDSRAPGTRASGRFAPCGRPRVKSHLSREACFRSLRNSIYMSGTIRFPRSKSSRRWISGVIDEILGKRLAADGGC